MILHAVPPLTVWELAAGVAAVPLVVTIIVWAVDWVLRGERQRRR
jgi:hypothetical protein